ncbi:thiamine biosynthesis lipoprotein ApbE precursor [Andreesenia angusta]|uniref:FAD:protein FMN transferase n=1 Tax=Andreesenia angusta TaxID=39480 RepID=A0A1S1V9R8_9FIRM|nr:FAD:protein FMN transferase [Andreesenia angusta]OHW62469.1 thiamine biosynthesis lipoprotein ApbE precursor [Andreesenia angusta]
MNRKRITTVIILALIAFSIYRAQSVSSKSSSVNKTSYLMGTIVNLTIYDPLEDNLFSESFDIIEDIESKMSLNIDDSEVNSINKNPGVPVPVSDETIDVIERGLYYSEVSGGKFDITSGSLVKLWDIGGENAKVPSEEEIAAVLPSIDYKSVKVDRTENTVTLLKPGTTLDLGGIAKGYAADAVSEYLKSKGVKKAIVDIGGNLFLIGTNEEDELWKVGIKNPFSESRNDYIGIVESSESSVVTSGVYERFLESDGVKYHHILDPDTGYPSDNEIMGVSIICDKSIDADGLSTSVFLLGLEDGIDLVEGLDGVEAIFITKSKEVYLTSGISDAFELKNSEFKIIKRGS